MTIILELTPDMEGQLQRVAQAQGKDVTTLLLDTARRHLRQDVLPKTDAALLKIINAPLVPEVRRKRDALLALQKQSRLSEAEQETLAALIDKVEIANARRWQSIAELAERRGLTLAQITHQLQIPLP